MLKESLIWHNSTRHLQTDYCAAPSNRPRSRVEIGGFLRPGLKDRPTSDAGWHEIEDLQRLYSQTAERSHACPTRPYRLAVPGVMLYGVHAPTALRSDAKF